MFLHHFVLAKLTVANVAANTYVFGNRLIFLNSLNHCSTLLHIMQHMSCCYHIIDLCDLTLGQCVLILLSYYTGIMEWLMINTGVWARLWCVEAPMCY